MKRLWLLLVCLIAAGARAQVVDASHVEGVQILSAAWRVHQGAEPKEDARYADPALDDSSWPLIETGHTFAMAHVLNSATGHSEWRRSRRIGACSRYLLPCLLLARLLRAPRPRPRLFAR